MPVDRPGDYVGDHGGAYTDMDGMRKQFTYIDHDKKPMTMGQADSPEEGWNTKYRASLVERITAVSASLCPTIFADFTIRGEGKTSIEWNMDMLLDNGMPLSQLRDLTALVENANSMVRIPR